MQRNMKRSCAPDRRHAPGQWGGASLAEEGAVCASGCRKSCRCYWRRLNQLHCAAPPVVHVAQAAAMATVAAHRAAGVPCVVRGQSGWAAFAYPWLRRKGTGDAKANGDDGLRKRKAATLDCDGLESSRSCERNPSPTTTASSPISCAQEDDATAEASNEHANEGGNDEAPITSLDDGPFEINVDAFVADVGDEKVPVITPNYDETAPLKEFVTIRDYLRKAWCAKHRNWYLHQWQFPLSATARQVLCYRNSNLSVLGYNLLHMWYDTLMGDCPFQYIFMGRANTFSRMHRDKGGLAILIAPIVGEKEVIMVHRDDTHRLYHCMADVYNPDFGEFPLSSFVRAWKVVLKPGDILIMPANTYHAARNLSPCLSYSRFHLDEINLPLFVQSFLDVDCASMPQATMIWNMTSECMKVLDQATETERHNALLISMVKARWHKRQIAQEYAPEKEAGSADSDAATDHTDQESIDLSFHPSPQVAHSALCKLRHVVQAILQDRASSAVCAITPSAEPSMDISTEEWLSLRKDVDTTLHEYHYRDLPTAPPMYLISTNPTKPKGPKGIPIPIALTSDALEAEPASEDEEEEASSRHIALPSAEEIEIAASLTKGRVVKIARCRKILTAKVLQIAEMEAAFIHYEGWPRYFEEYRPLPQLRHLDEASVESLRDLCIGMGVLAQWGSGNDSYRATTLALYNGPLLRVRYPELGPDWDQWVRPLHVSVSQKNRPTI